MATPRYSVPVILCAFLSAANGVLNVTILIYGMWKPPYLQCLPYTAPGFELAAASINENYVGILNVQLQFASSKSVSYCPDISANYEQIAHKYYDLADEDRSTLAVFYAGCDASTTLADFGREWNLLTINIGTTFSNLRNRTTYPTAIALGPYQYQIYGVMIGQLTAAYNWTSVALVYDVAGISIAYLWMGQEVRRYMQKTHPQVDVHAFPIDTRETVDFQSVITDISILTRVIIIALPANDVKRFLMAFMESGENREEYVQISIDYAGTVGSVVTALWQSIFIVSICYEHDDMEIPKLKRAMKEKTMNKYNATFPNGEPSEFVVTAYTSLLLYAQVLNETLNAGHDSRDGTRLGQSMLNRSFTFPTVGDLYIDSYGERQNMICLYSFQPALQRFKKVRYFDSATQKLHDYPNVSINWGTPENLPPLNEPKCGFRKDNCPRIGDSTIAGAVSGTILVALAVFCSVLRVKKGTTDEKWWMVDFQYLSRAVDSGNKEIAGRSHPQSLKSSLLLNAAMNYRGIPVWAKVVQISRRAGILHSSEGTVSVTPKFGVLMAEIRSVAFRCQNINPLVGIGFAPIRLTYLTAFCQRGSLGSLIDEGTLDWGLKCSLIADLVEGVSAIHRSTLRRHGHLRPSKCLIDGRFVLKINEVGLYDILSELQIELTNPKNTESSGQSLHNAWVAPELRINPTESATSASTARRVESSADVYAVGGLINYILQNHKLEKDETLMDFVQSSKHGIPPHAVPVLAALLSECRNMRPADRPNIWQVKMEISRVMENPGKLLDRLLKRLADYAAQLEHAVALRSEMLKQEMEKCDSLLREMLPRYVLVQLRSGHLVQPEMFDSVTLLMTYVAGFEEFVQKCQSTPLELVTFLNTMFTLFDGILVKYDCYKVETITDSCLVVSGLPVENGEHVHVMAGVALEMRNEFERTFAADGLQIKAGLHSGSCAAGVVGTARPRYCVFGDSVNVTSRLAYSSEPGKIHISNTTEALLSMNSGNTIQPRGMTYLKGVGSIMTFWLEGR